MKILLGNNTLSFFGGSETWTYTLAVALKRAGHDVFCFSPALGEISNMLEKEDIKCFNEIISPRVNKFSVVLDRPHDHTYDVIIANHWHIVEYLRGNFPKTPIISTIHGIIHNMPDGSQAPEHPSMNGGVNEFVSVSEEVRDLLAERYNIHSNIIRNAFDLKIWKASKKSPKPKQFLINTNYFNANDQEIEVVRQVAKHYGAKLAAIGIAFTQTLDTYPIVKSSDVIIAQGRSVLEGVATGGLGIVHGRFGTGGVICQDNIDELRRFNFSGRNSGGVVWTKEEFINAIDSYYKKETFDWGVNYIRSNHNISLAVESYLQLARSLNGQRN